MKRRFAPFFPYFGGKGKVAHLVWERFGDVRNYVEPFAGSLAVLLERPHWPFEVNRTETVNDANCFLANFWRALQADPEAVARHADWPVNEADLHARHLHLVTHDAEHVARCKREPKYYDARIAGWWVWGACQWIGSGWTELPKSTKRPHLRDLGMGVHRPSQQLPHLGDDGVGVHRPSQKLPHLGNDGRGVHRPSQQLPHLGDDGRGVHRPSQGHTLHEYLHSLAERLRRVRVCCGDWSRVTGPTPTVKMGITGVFLDPPYTAAAKRKSDLYATDNLDVGHDVFAWAVEHGDDPRLRIAVCGYEGEYDFPGDWTCLAWKAPGGYGSQGDKSGRANANRERIWFSPHCLPCPTTTPATSRATTSRRKARTAPRTS